MKIFQTKKGELPNMLIFLVSITILAIGLFVFAFVIPTISTGLGNAGLNNSAEGVVAVNQLTDIGTKLIQNGFFLLFVGLIMGTMISSFLARTHPIFLFLYIIFLGITIFLATYLGNFYETFSSTEIFANLGGSSFSLIICSVIRLGEISLNFIVLSPINSIY